MPSGTTISKTENKRRIRAFMEIPQDDEDFSAILDGTFNIDQAKGQKFKSRLAIKDYQITTLPTESEVEIEEEAEKLARGKVLPEWLREKIGFLYTNEYIAIKRQEHISVMLEQIDNMETTLSDKTSFAMHYQLFLNEIKIIYKKFVKTRQDEHFLSIANLLEEIFDNNVINKKLIKESKAILKTIKDIDHIDYNHYQHMVKRLFGQGINVINLKEKPNEK